jgi:hypothetical protein
VIPPALALAAVSLSLPVHGPAFCVLPWPCQPPTFHGPYLPAVFSGRPNPTPDTLAGAPPYLAPAPLAVGYSLPAPTPVPTPGATKSDELPAPTPYRFGPSGVPPRLGPGPSIAPE